MKYRQPSASRSGRGFLPEGTEPFRSKGGGQHSEPFSLPTSIFRFIGSTVRNSIRNLGDCRLGVEIEKANFTTNQPLS